MSDDAQALVAEAIAGNQAAIESLLARYLPGLRAFIRLRAGEVIRARESTSDLAQSVCLEVLRHLDRFQYRGEAGFKHWLYATALRKITNRYEYYAAQKRDARRELHFAAESTAAPEAQVADCYRTFWTPSQDAAQREEVLRLENAFDQLPEHYREVISLAHIVGLSRAEIAQHLGCTEVAARGLLLRALSALAGLVERGGAGR